MTIEVTIQVHTANGEVHDLVVHGDYDPGIEACERGHPDNWEPGVGSTFEASKVEFQGVDIWPILLTYGGAGEVEEEAHEVLDSFERDRFQDSGFGF